MEKRICVKSVWKKIFIALFVMSPVLMVYAYKMHIRMPEDVKPGVSVQSTR